MRFSVTSWLDGEDLPELVEVVGRGTVTGGLLLSPELEKPGQLGFVNIYRIKYSLASSFAKSDTGSEYRVSIFFRKKDGQRRSLSEG